MIDFDEQNDADLVRLTLEGQREAYRPLVSRYQGHVYGLAYSVVGNWAEAQDIAQETFIRAYSNLDQLRDPTKFAAWLRRVAFGVTMDWMRTFRPKLFAQYDGKVDLDSLEIPDFAPGPAEEAERRELASAVLRAVASLPPKYRVPLTMFHLDGLSYQKVAEFLDIPLGTAKSIIHRAQEKLKAAVSGPIGKETMAMVQDVFNEHKLQPEFAGKIIEKVPPLGWDRGKECTFLGALEAALAATPHPYAYSDLMGFTGLAFRVRWWKRTDQKPDLWCPSCAVGEMNEEIAAADQATGWPLRVEFAWDQQQRETGAKGLVESISAGKPVLTYDAGLDMGVVYGYGVDGKSVFFHGYNNGKDAGQMPVSNLGWMWVYLGDHRPAPPIADSVHKALRMAVLHWERGSAKSGPGEYWYGKAALERWIADLEDVSGVPEKQLQVLFHVNSFNYRTVVDARKAAVQFLRQTAMPNMSAEVRGHLASAAEIYERGLLALLEVTQVSCFLFMHQFSKWSESLRRREQQALMAIKDMDQAAVTCIKQAMACAG